MVLRDGGIGAPILVLGGLEPGTERDAALRGIDPLMGTVDELRNWDQTARTIGRKLSCHLLFNTGMNRLGIDFDPSLGLGRDSAAWRVEGLRLGGVERSGDPLRFRRGFSNEADRGPRPAVRKAGGIPAGGGLRTALHSRREQRRDPLPWHWRQRGAGRAHDGAPGACPVRLCQGASGAIPGDSAPAPARSRVAGGAAQDPSRARRGTDRIRGELRGSAGDADRDTRGRVRRWPGLASLESRIGGDSRCAMPHSGARSAWI